MPCAVGRNTKKYGGTVVASTLQDVTENGNTTTLSIQTDSFFIGDGSLLTNIPGVSGYGNLEQVTASGNTTTHEVTFENTFTSLEALGNVVVVGNVTAMTFYGDGANLTGIVTLTDFNDNVSRIVDLESNLIANSERIDDLITDLGSNVLRIINLESNLVANSERIDALETEVQPVARGGTGLTSFTIGDILYASGTNQLTKLSIGSVGTGNVLTTTSSSSFAWRPPTGSGTGIVEVDTLEDVTSRGSTTTHQVTFENPTTSMNALGNVVVLGNVTALTFYGDGTNLTGIPKMTDFNDNVTRIVNLESNLIANSERIDDLETYLGSNVTRIINLESNLIANSERIDVLENLPIVANTSTFTGVVKGDLLYASLDNQITALMLSGTDGHVLTADTTTGLPAWKAPTGGGGATLNNITESGGFTGISNTNPQYTLQVGSNVVIDDAGPDVVYVTGNIYTTRNISVVGSTFSDSIHCRRIFIKNTEVVAERPTRIIRQI